LVISVTSLKDTLVGNIFVAQSPRGLCQVSFGRRSESTFLKRLAEVLGSGISVETKPLPIVQLQLKNYLAGTATSFSLEVDLRKLTPFQRLVLRQTMKVPYGRTSSYGEIATRIGRPNAHRAVGNAMGANPIPIVIPCHRVVASDGTLGGYSGGISYKKKLLALEGVL
jgi:methylated-DNA-[protein]-cysteine S-methyltransferase